MAQGKRLPSIRDPEDLDSLDKQIIALVKVEPDISSRTIATQTGYSHWTICARRKRLERSGWLDLGRRELESIIPEGVKAIAEAIESANLKDRADVALRLFRGLGLLVDKHKVGIDVNDSTAVREFLSKIPDNVLDELDDESG